MNQIKQLLIAVLEKMNLWEQNAKSIDELPTSSSVVPTAKIHVSEGGTSKALELQKLINASISTFVNQVTSIGEIGIIDNTLTIPTATWKIANISYSKSTPTVINVPFSATGTNRIDIIVADTSNQIYKVSGTDTIGIAIRPNQPLNTVIVTEINVSEDSLTAVPFPLNSNQIDAIVNSNNPSATNHFATMDDISALAGLDQDNIPKERVYSLSDIGAADFDSDVKTLLAEKIATESLTIGEKEIPLFEVNAELPIVGNVIDNSFSGSTLDADFTTNLTLGSEYTMSSGLNILSGNSAFGKYIQLEKTIAVTRWKQSLTFVVNSITSSSYGIALGLFSSNSTAMSVAKSSIVAQAFLHSDGSLKGKIRLYRDEDASTSFATSSVALSFSATDRLKLELTRIDNKFIVDFYNLTTSTSIQLEYDFDASITTVPLIPNTGKFKIYAFSGSYKIENYKYDNKGYLGGVAYLGDSISNSYVADVFTDGYQYKTTDNRRWNTFGGQADKSGDVLLALPQLTTENIPSKAVIFLGMNDYLQSVSTATYKSNLNTIISALEAVGTEVFLITPSATNLGDISAYVTAALEVATDNSLLSINAFTLLKASSGTGLNSIYDGDDVHPNSLGHQHIADAIKSTFLTLEPSFNTGRQVYILKNRGKGSLNDIVASDLYLLVDESNTSNSGSVPTTATEVDALQRNGSNANSDVDLGISHSLKASTITIQNNGASKSMKLLATNMSVERTAEFQDQEYIGIEDISNKGVPNGYVPLNADNKIDLQYILDALLGQVLYGGVVDVSTSIATLTNNAKSKLGTSSATITLTDDTTAITGYGSNEGIYYIVTTGGTFAGISLDVGDWLISIGSAWKKVDNTDAVTSFMGRLGAITLLSADVISALGFTPQSALGFTPDRPKSWISVLDPYTGTGSTTLQKLSNQGSSGNGSKIVDANSRYRVEIEFAISGLSSTTNYVQFGFLGSAVIAKIFGESFASKSATLISSNTPSHTAIIVSTISPALMTTGSQTFARAKISFTFTTGTGGSLIPSFATNVSTTPIVEYLHFDLIKLGADTTTTSSDIV